MSQPSSALVQKLLLSWFAKQARFLPWRSKGASDSSDVGVGEARSSYLASGGRDPYRVLVSELMLQQTQVDRVIPKYLAFIDRWPTVHELAESEQAEVVRFWKGLGYNRRARFLHQTAKQVVGEHDGSFPRSKEDLKKLPGIGEYTAAAICAFAYGEELAVLDTNVRRVLGRVFLGLEQFEANEKEIQEIANQSIPRGKADPWHQAIMDLGATICQARVVNCESCPLQAVCLANQQAQAKRITYTEVLNQKRMSRPNPKKAQKFETTDRYFRGRIIDELREGPVHLEELRTRLENDHNLTDRARWGRLVESLVLDGLITIQRATARLA